MDTKRIDERIEVLNIELDKLLEGMSSYKKAPVNDRIECRIIQAEIIALEELKKGVNLADLLQDCIINEQYSGAEGINRAIKCIQL